MILRTRKTARAAYHKLSPKRAKKWMDGGAPYILADVRTPEEFSEGHIKGAVNIPLAEIEERAGAELPNKSALIFLYCRSGARSEKAARALVQLGYLNIQDIGGILSWPYPDMIG